MECWTKLSDTEKIAVPVDKKFIELPVDKNFIELKEEAEQISIEQYNQELDEVMIRMDNGKYYSHEQAVQMLK